MQYISPSDILENLPFESMPRKNVARLTDRPDMSIVVYHGRKTATKHNTTYTLNALNQAKLMRNYQEKIILIRFFFVLFLVDRKRENLLFFSVNTKYISSHISLVLRTYEIY